VVLGQPLQVWLSELKSTNQEVRDQASRALAALRPEHHQAAGPLLMAFKEEDELTHLRVAQGLANLGPRQVPVLQAALSFDDPRVRGGAARALGLLGPEAAPAIGALKALLRDEKTSVRVHAAQALWSID